ncbi:MAG: (2Fe-2S) ferredoxin domain-containing protein [Bacteroidales bacterium]|jgi:NADH:ubiquinone oxidoreductase subunit E|nr:(2Fe-2S) ferredoxin domain-containing protein [Bacteroidales bacterium]
MDGQGITITICMGSSCFSRGNKKTLQVIQDYLKETGRLSDVTFQGSHCFGNCEFGPMLKINEAQFNQVTEANVISILEQYFETQG